LGAVSSRGGGVCSHAATALEQRHRETGCVPVWDRFSLCRRYFMARLGPSALWCGSHRSPRRPGLWVLGKPPQLPQSARCCGHWRGVPRSSAGGPRVGAGRGVGGTCCSSGIDFPPCGRARSTACDRGVLCVFPHALLPNAHVRRCALRDPCGARARAGSLCRQCRAAR